MMKTKKAKSIFSALFAVVMALCLVAGLNLVKTNAKADGETATVTTQWKTSRKIQLEELSDSGLQYSGQSATIINNTNLLDVPGRTVTFQFMSKGQVEWAAFMFLNGRTNWQKAVWSGYNQECDTLPHIIVQDGQAQIHANTTAAIYGAAAVGIEGMVPSISNQLHTVEVHLGTGSDGDVSYIKIDGSLLVRQGTTGTTNETVLPWLKAGDFTENGCYIAFHCNHPGGAGGVTLLGEYNAPYVEYSTVSEALNGTVNIATTAPEDMSFVVKNVTGNAKLIVNGNDVTNTDTYAIEDVDGGKKVTIRSAFWNTYFDQISRNSTLTLVAENGKASVYTTVQKKAPPAWRGENYAEIADFKDVVYTFEYRGDVTTDEMVVKTGVVSIDSEALTAGSDYTISQNGGVYTFTLKKEYIETKIGNYRSIKFRISIGDDSLEGSLYCKFAQEGWVARPVDLVKDTELKTEGYYVSANLNAFSATTLSSRVYYNKGFDVTKPISLEVEAFGEGTIWALLGVADSLKPMDYFSNETTNELSLSALIFGKGRKDIQKLGGFVPTASSNANYEHLPNVKNLAIEMYFGVNEASEGYFKINGQKIATPSTLQSDFASGFAYIGFFFNHPETTFNFKVNKDINGIGVTGPVGANDEANYTVDIANPANDLVLDVINTDGTQLKVSSDSGIVSAADDIAYENGKLTIKKSFFKKLLFAKHGKLTIEDEKTHTGTEINLTYISSAMEAPHIAFATKGELADVKFKLGLASVTSVMKGDAAISDNEWNYIDGTLTVKKSNIEDAVGANEFIAVSDGKLYPLYVYVAKFADGYAKTGDGTVETGNGAYMITGDNYVTPMKSYDLNAGVSFKIDFKSTLGYYKNGRDNQSGYVRFDFFDPYSRYTFTYILHTNFQGKEISDNSTALYEGYYVTDAKGNEVVFEKTRGINVSKSGNTEALGVHNIKFAVENGKLTIAVDTARKTTISDSFGTFNFGATILTVETPSSSSSAEMKVGLKEYGAGEEFDYKAISLKDVTPEPGESGSSSGSEKPTESKKGGCGSSVAVGSIMLPALAAVLFVFKKKEEK